MGRAGGVLVCILAVGLPPAGAQEKGRLTFTTGSVALLANQSASETTELLRQALLDPDPRVRAVAARVAGAGSRADLWDALIGALAREQDPATGAELVRDVLYVGGPAAIDAVRPQVRRLGAFSAFPFSEWLARTDPDRFIDTLPEFAGAAGSDAGGLAFVITGAAVQHHSRADRLRRAWMAYAPDGGWRPVLSAGFLSPASTDTETRLLEDALNSERASVREETLWFVVSALADSRSVPTSVLDAGLPRDVPGLTPWESIGRELIARRRRNIKPTDASDVLKVEAPHRLINVSILATLPELTAAERTVLTTLAAGRGPGESLRWDDASSVRTVSGVTSGVIASTLERAGCHPKNDNSVGVALLTYRADGRPRRIELAETGLTAPCKTAFTALVRLVVAETDYGAIETAQTVVLPITRGFTACTSEPEPPPAARQPVRGEMKTPHKIRDVKPEYPLRAQQDRIQGAVLIDARVTAGGCVDSARIVRSIPALNLAALRAVLDWKYEPARLDGRPVPIAMTMTVIFTLQ